MPVERTGLMLTIGAQPALTLVGKGNSIGVGRVSAVVAQRARIVDRASGRYPPRREASRAVRSVCAADDPGRAGTAVAPRWDGRARRTCSSENFNFFIGAMFLRIPSSAIHDGFAAIATQDRQWSPDCISHELLRDTALRSRPSAR